ncbi:Dimeric dUTPase (EC [uncultured Gammaproteobacteria bacterium]|nr:Dimeric dUTPase (EC [uncultured Gammaproteobacteria bacterium]
MSEAIHFGDTQFAEAYEDMTPEREINPEMTVEILEKMLAVAASANVDKSKNSCMKLQGCSFRPGNDEYECVGTL